MTRVALFLNHQPGIDIAEYFSMETQDEVAAVYLSGENISCDKAIVNAASIPNNRVFSFKEISSPQHLDWLNQEKIDFMISVYWPKKIPLSAIKLAKQGTINFHPSLLPHNRGCYPHIYAILNNTPCGVTLHQLEEDFDTGAIWVQKAVEISPYDTAYSLYVRLQKEIVTLFKTNWPSISQEKLSPYPQKIQNISYHPEKEIYQYNKIDLDKTYTAREFINLLRARSLGSLGFAHYEENGHKVYLNLQLNDQADFTGAEHAKY